MMEIRVMYTMYITFGLLLIALFTPYTWRLALVFLALTYSTFWLLSIVRLRNTFRDTIYEVNKYILYIFYITLSILISVEICLSIAIIGFENVEDRRYEQSIISYSIYTIAAINVIFSAILLREFSTKLFHLIIAQRTSIHIFKLNIVTNDIDFNDRQKKLLSTMVRQKVLGIQQIWAASFFTVICAIWWPLLWTDKMPLLMLNNFWWIYQAICMYLLFGSNISLYNIFCKCLDHCCLKRLQREAQKHILKKHMSMQQSVESESPDITSNDCNL